MDSFNFKQTGHGKAMRFLGSEIIDIRKQLLYLRVIFLWEYCDNFLEYPQEIYIRDLYRRALIISKHSLKALGRLKRRLKR